MVKYRPFSACIMGSDREQFLVPWLTASIVRSCSVFSRVEDQADGLMVSSLDWLVTVMTIFD